MSSVVVSLKSYATASSALSRKKKRDFEEPRLPLEPSDFVGRILFWPSKRLQEASFDKALNFGGVQTIVDLRDEPELGELRSVHHFRCKSLERWNIGYFRLGPLISKAERTAKLSFDVAGLFTTELKNDPSLMASFSESPNRGAVLVIYPENTNRLDIFLSACRLLNLTSFDKLPFQKSQYKT